MALALNDRVQQTGTANTTVSFTLSGSVTGFQSFAVIGNGNTTYYSATDGSGNWEVGIGTYSTSGPTLTRTTILSSSNSNTAVTFSGAVNVFVTYPSSKSVNLDGSGNASALGTVSSGTWNGSTIGVAYGGTGVTASSGANSVVLRDASQNVAVNRLNQTNTNTTAAAGTTALTAASSYIHTLVGTGGQTYTMPDATTLTTGVAFLFNNMATGTLTLQDYATGPIGTIPSGGAGAVFLTINATVGGTWDLHSYLPEGVTFGTNAFNLGSSVVSGGTWQGGTIQPAYGGTGLITFVAADNALYSSGATTLTAGTLPVLAGGTGVTTATGTGAVVRATSPTLVTPALGTPASGTLTNCTFPTLNQNTTGSAGSVANTLTIGTGLSGTSYNGSAAVTIANSGVTSAVAGTGITVSGATGAVTFSIGQAVATSSNVQFNSLGVGTAGSATAGEIRATNNITAYYSSDRKLKENIQDVQGALEKVCAIGSKEFDWTDEYIAAHGGEDGYFVTKSDFGVIAQDVQAVFPQATRTREDGTLAVDYEKLSTLAFGAIKELLKRIEALEAK